MAEQETEKEESSNPNKEDDDLDALLDSALEDFEKPAASGKSSEKKGETKPPNVESSTQNTQEPLLDDWDLSESDLKAAAAEFEQSMKTILGDDDEFLRQWNEFSEKSASVNPGLSNSETESMSENASTFEAHLLKTMKDIAGNAKDMSNSPADLDENFLKAMADMGVDGEAPDVNQGIFPMMQGMMMNLLSKDVLYPALDELRAKYPAWLEEKKSVLANDVHKNYSKQYKLVCEICSEYDKENEEDSNEVKRKRFDKLMGLMQKMQEYGQPPHELVEGRGQEAAAFGENLTPDKCPMM